MYAEEEEIDRIFTEVDELCWPCSRDGDWTPIDNMLRAVCIEETKTVHLISWLTATICVKTKLPYRLEFYEKVYERAASEDKHPDNLLDGLK